MNRQTHTMPHTAIAANFDKPLYIKLDLPPEVTLQFILLVNDVVKPANLFLSKILNSNTGVDPSGSQNALA
jgi:hypothetical protein